MNTAALDPVIHHPGRLRILAALAALPDGDTLSIIRLQNMIGLPEGSPITHVCELSQAGYLRIGRTGGHAVPATAALTRDGRAALARYTAALRRLAQGGRNGHHPPAPHLRAGDADRDAAVAALGEHFAQGRLTLDEFSTRLDAALTATTFGELSQAAQGLPGLTGPPGRAPRGCSLARALIRRSARSSHC